MARIVPRSATLGSAKRSSREDTSEPPRWVEPQLCKLVEKAPGRPGWVHEAKFDGYRMAARIDRGDFQLLTRSGRIGRKNTPRPPRPWPSCPSHQPISMANSAASAPTA
jgi:hypothetical protein